MNAPHQGMLISVDYWAAFVAYAIIDRALAGSLPARLHHLLTVLASVGFLWWFTAIGGPHLAALLLSLMAIYYGVKSFRAALPIGVAGCVWVLGKTAVSFELGGLSLLFFLGVSFLLVKVWTFAKDMSDDRIDKPDVLCFLAYCLYFPCFISGPMHFHGEFQEAFTTRKELTAADAIHLVWRVLHGLVKVLVLARLLRPFALEPLVEQGLSSVDPADLALRSVVYSLVIYLDFSGYSDIVIASTKLAGIETPENFRWPYVARNLRDFWQRWHITFTRFLTRYLFVPLTRKLQKGRMDPSRVSLIGYVVTFGFCGIWHGTTLNFVAWGLFHALGLTVHDIYNRRRMVRIRASKKPAPKPTLLGQVLPASATFLFVSAGWTLFILPLSFWTR